MSYTQIPLEKFQETFSTAIGASDLLILPLFARLGTSTHAKSASCVTELSSVALGGEIVSVSDEFFAEAFHLLQVEVGIPCVIYP